MIKIATNIKTRTKPPTAPEMGATSDTLECWVIFSDDDELPGGLTMEDVNDSGSIDEDAIAIFDVLVGISPTETNEILRIFDEIKIKYTCRRCAI
jgi:hypothetical protein